MADEQSGTQREPKRTKTEQPSAPANNVHTERILHGPLAAPPATSRLTLAALRRQEDRKRRLVGRRRAVSDLNRGFLQRERERERERQAVSKKERDHPQVRVSR